MAEYFCQLSDFKISGRVFQINSELAIFGIAIAYQSTRIRHPVLVFLRAEENLLRNSIGPLLVRCPWVAIGSLNSIGGNGMALKKRLFTAFGLMALGVGVLILAEKERLQSGWLLSHHNPHNFIAHNK